MKNHFHLIDCLRQRDRNHSHLVLFLEQLRSNEENYENEILQLYNVNDCIRHDRQKQLGYALNIADIVLHIL